jgi:hypothetical protein
MEVEEFNKLKKGDVIEHYECKNGISFWEKGTVIERDERNKAFILVHWDNGEKRYTGRQLIRREKEVESCVII